MCDLSQCPTNELLAMLGKLKGSPASKCQSGKAAYKKAVSEKMDAIGLALIQRLQNKKVLAVYAACA